MNRLAKLCIALALTGSPSYAQTSFPEIEPNGQKAEATSVNGITAGDTITGLSSGTVTTLGSTLSNSADVFRVKTSALPLGIYRHRLSLTTSTITGHTATIRGLTQSGTVGVGGTAGTTDANIQATITTSTPPRYNQWYGFGKSEEIYYRVAGVLATTEEYTATMSTTPVVPTVIVPSFESGSPITVSTLGQTTADTELMLFDANFAAIPGALNDDEGPAGTTLQSRLTRTLAPGTYYLAVAGFGLCTDQVAASDDDFQTGLLTDFPDCVVQTNISLASLDLDFTITATNGSFHQTNQTPPNSPYGATWFRFTTSNGAPGVTPPNDSCVNAAVLSVGTTTISALGSASNDGTASCDPGGVAAKDVWYTFQNGASPGALSIDTCSTSGTDTVLTLFNACGGVELACSDTCSGTPCNGPNACILGFALNANQSVLIRVSDKGLGGNEVTIHTSFAPALPSNDGCMTPISLPGPGAYSIDNSLATTGAEGQAEALCNFVSVPGISRDLWYSYTAVQNATVTVTTCGLLAAGSSQDSKIAVYPGSSCPTNGSALACNDDQICAGFSGLNSTVTFGAVCGTTYLFQLGMYPGNPGSMLGAFSVTESSGTPCTTPTTSFCLGDGSGAACPCANTGATGNGCASSSFAAGANLSASGIAGASDSTDTLVLTATNIPGPGLFFQSSGVSTTPAHFGDGLLCAAVGIVRLGVGFPSGGTAVYPGGSTPIPIHTVGQTQSGDTRSYQCWYRSGPALCGAGTYSLTQGLTLTWVP